MSKVNVTVRLEEEVVAFLDKLAEHEERDRSYLIKKAVNKFVDLQKWQIEEIERAVQEADQGLFASKAEVKQMFSKWQS